MKKKVEVKISYRITLLLACARPNRLESACPPSFTVRDRRVTHIKGSKNDFALKNNRKHIFLAFFFQSIPIILRRLITLK